LASPVNQDVLIRTNK